MQGRTPINPLNRSQTDSNIHYPYEDLPEAAGAAGFVSKEGGFDYHVLLQVSYRQHPPLNTNQFNKGLNFIVVN